MCARVRLCARVLVVLYWQDASGRGRGCEPGEEARAPGGEPGRASPPPPSLPPRLDPVVKAERERERQALSRPAACGRRQEPGRRGAEARRGQAGEEGPDPRVDLSSASLRARLLASRTPRLAHFLARKETGIRGPAGEPGAWWPICGAASLLGLHPATGTLEFGVLG